MSSASQAAPSALLTKQAPSAHPVNCAGAGSVGELRLVHGRRLTSDTVVMITAGGSTLVANSSSRLASNVAALISTVNAVTFDRLFTDHFRLLIELARVLQGRDNPPSPRIAREVRSTTSSSR